ncbi:ATP dependent DNA ligase [Crepidotus variabilis]|uniref:ATP dependent DNA ligase n=1 Tax=Crepidotus variabilis TaxID=179855 RepID=A0A9P6JWV0_9AGAR|nr:ATP dependent DNA ligase [Crepidotus variabilis]
MALTLRKYRGALALMGSQIDSAAATAIKDIVFADQFKLVDSTTYHVTLATKEELRGISSEKLEAINPDVRSVFPLGLGSQSHTGVYWAVVIWAAGQQIRKQLGLQPKHFHITLTSSDIHDIAKGINSLLSPPELQSMPMEALDHTIFTLQTFGQYKQAKVFATLMISRDPSSEKGYLRLGDATYHLEEQKLAMLSYASCWTHSTDEKIRSYCFKKMVDCSKRTEWGHVFQEDEMVQIVALKDIAPMLLQPWPEALWSTLNNKPLCPTLCLESRHPLHIPSQNRAGGFYKLPRFFRWLIPNHLAIMSTPRNEDDIMALGSPHIGIRHILTLTEETPLPESWFRGKKVTNTFLPIPNYHPPSIEQMDIIIRLFDDQDKLPLLVHCGGGKGRAGTVAACYLAAFGFGKPSQLQDHPEMSAPDAISTLRSLRPGNLETHQQEAFVSTWCSTIWKRQSVYPDVPSEPPPCPLEIEGALPQDADLFMLVGLPGSGKSWFSKSLLARNPEGWARISQDDSGSRSSCETQIGRTPKKNQRVLLDRCNTSAEDRKSWLKLASNWAQMRTGHATLPPGGRVRSAVAQMKKMYERPSIGEGWKAIVVVKSFEAAHEAVLRFSPLVAIFKFPRTPHLIDIGAATNDDVHEDLTNFSKSVSLSTTQHASKMQPRVVITEKVDGANMGFSLSASKDRILVQNRSHHVNPTTHEQFKKLGGWVSAHDEELRKILDRDPYFPERYILFGEWMYATHSIAYTQLADLFMAYDLYDRGTKKFIDRCGLQVLLGDTTIKIVPVIFEGDELPSKDDLLKMIQKQSMFYEGRVEGVYVKVEESGYVKMRGKVVRSDFIAGNEHWTRGGLKMNGIKIDRDISSDT